MGFGVGGLIALAVLFLGVVMLSNVGLRGMRIDLTQNKLYTLSPGTKQVLAELKEPVNLYFYFSHEAAAKQAPLIMPYANRVREFLEELAARSGGKIRLRSVDPQPFSDEEDRASEYGLQSLQTGGGDALYFGLAGTNSTDGRASIPSFQADREEFLEYDVAKLINELGTPKKPVIGLISSLGLQGQFNPMTGQMGEPWPILTQLQELFTIRSLTADVDHIDKDVDVLMLVHPKHLPPKTLYAIDQFVMRGGRMLLFVDPTAGADTSGQDPSNPLAGAMADHSSDLEPLLKAWGVDYDPGKVVGDLERGLEVRTNMQSPPIRHIGILGLGHGDMNQKDVVTASLDKINLATAGALAAHPGAKTTFEPLLLSSTSAGLIPALRFNGLTDPATLRDGFKPTGIRYAIAARITGPVQSAYPQGAPPDQKPAAGPPVAHLAKTSAPANIVIIADTDLLMDYMWVQTRELFGQRVAQAFANNGDFIANILDNLSGSSALISVRGRATFSRPFERVEALRHQADDRLRSKALELQAELQQTETKLTQLQSKRNDQSSIMLSPEQEAELKRFVAEKARVRKELRETQRGLDVDINRLNTWLKIINIGVVPFLVAVAGVIILWLRRRRRVRRDGRIMSRQRFIALAVAAALAISGALYLSTQRNLPLDSHGAALLPYLAGELNTVTALEIRKGSATPLVTVHEKGGQWTVAQRGDYPADVPKLRKLLLALSDAKIVEQKTSNPANFPVIGVEDPSLPGASGAELSFTARDGRHAVIIGKPVGDGNFARRGGENTSYSVEPAISFETEARYWIEPKLIDIAAADIQSITIKPAGGTAYTVRRAAAGGNFELDGVPPGRKAADAPALAPSPTTYSGLTADDVGAVSDVDFSKATVATVTLSGGNVITLTGATNGDKHWVQLQASKDAALNAKAAGRAFELTGYRYDAIFRPLEQLLVPKPSPAVASKAHPASKPAKKPVPAPKP